MDMMEVLMEVCVLSDKCAGNKKEKFLPPLEQAQPMFRGFETGTDVVLSQSNQ